MRLRAEDGVKCKVFLNFYGGKVEKLLYHIDCYNKNILDGYIE